MMFRVIIIAVSTLLLGALLGYGAATTRVVPAGLGAGGDRRALLRAVDRIERLEQELAIARRGSQITDEANVTLRQQIVALESSVAELNADVAFYRRLLGSGGSEKGLAVHDLQLQPTAAPRVWRYQLTLSQNLNKAKIVAGRFDLLAEGLSAGAMVELDSEALDLRPAGDDAAFEFKYFQQIEGSFSLPEGFEPASLRVRLRPESGRKTVVRRFEWPGLAADTAATEQQEETANVQSEERDG